jgi:DNA replication protein DnaC
MDETAQLRPKLTRLKLSGVLESLNHRLEEATKEGWDYTHFLLMLLSDEVERRDNKQLSRRVSKSGLDPQKTLATFDFSFNRSIHQPTMKQLCTCTFLRERQNLFLLGPSGVGKSHLAQAIGNEACLRGFDVLYRNTHTLFKWLAAGYADATHDRRMQQLRSVDVLILDDFGLRELSDTAQADLYEIISDRYEQRPTILTSNRDFDEWPQVFSNPLMGSAAMDRLVHRAVKLVLDGESYRMNAFISSTKQLTGGGKKATKN